MLKSIIIYYLKQMHSFDVLVSYLNRYPADAQALGFDDYIPSRNTFSNFMLTLGSQPFEELFYQLLAIIEQQGLLKGHQLAIDSTHVKAWSIRKSKDKHNKPEYLEGKNCDFAMVGMSPKGFQLGYRVHTVTLTRSELPVAVKIFPANMNDKRAFEDIFHSALSQVPSPRVISADKGFSSGKNRLMVENAGAMSILRPTKTDLSNKIMDDFIPEGISEPTYWKLYLRQLTVERSFGRLKGNFRLGSPE